MSFPMGRNPPYVRPDLLPMTTLMNLKLAAPIKTWDEAVPLGNGLLGGLLWGEGGRLRLSLDRGDLWDERPAPGNPLAGFTYAQMTRLVVARDNAGISKIVDGAYFADHPTKIPAGRIELDLAPGQTVADFELDLATATGRAHLAAAVGTVEAFFSAVAPVALVRVPGAAPTALRLLAPESGLKLGYPAPVLGAADGAQWFVQPAAEGESYCIFAAQRRVADATLIAIAVTYSPADGSDVVGVARSRVAAALAEGFAAVQAPHAGWWREFWAKSSIMVPDVQVMQHYHLVQYFYGAASRTGAPRHGWMGADPDFSGDALALA